KAIEMGTIKRIGFCNGFLMQLLLFSVFSLFISVSLSAPNEPLIERIGKRKKKVPFSGRRTPQPPGRASETSAILFAASLCKLDARLAAVCRGGQPASHRPDRGQCAEQDNARPWEPVGEYATREGCYTERRGLR